MRRYFIPSVLALVASALLPVMAHAQTATFTLPTDLAPQAVADTMLAGAKSYVLVGGGIIIILAIVIALIKGIGRKAARAVR
jgi:hypothetical protein